MGELADSKDSVLGDALEVIQRLGLTPMLIGAGARVLVALRHDLTPGRATFDWDLAVTCRDWPTFESLLEELCKGSDAAFEKTEVVHRLRHRETQVFLDIVPFGDLESPSGKITWPGGREMNVQGLEVVFNQSESTPVRDKSIQMASPVGQAQQKAAAYLDRRSRGEVHDVLDFLWVLRNYEGTQQDSRAMTESDVYDTIMNHDIDPQCWGAAMLGRDLAVFPDSALDSVRELLGELQQESSMALNHGLSGPASYNEEEQFQEVRMLAAAVLAGLQDARTTD